MPLSPENQPLFPKDQLDSSALESFWRPIHYLGSKLRLIQQIRDVIHTAEPRGGPVLDLFAGSGSVALGLAQDRPVVAADIQEYSRTICSALLCNTPLSRGEISALLEDAQASPLRKALEYSFTPLIELELDSINRAGRGDLEPLASILENGSVKLWQLAPEDRANKILLGAIDEVLARLREENLAESKFSIASRYFGGVYFSYRQAVALDILRAHVEELPSQFRDLACASVLSSASAIVNTVGKQFAQPLNPRRKNGEPKPNLLKSVGRDRFRNVYDTFSSWLTKYSEATNSNNDSKAVRGEFETILDQYCDSVAVVYADPPYTRDHYSRYYHVLETLSRLDNPAVSQVKLRGSVRYSRGVYREDRHQSPFSIVSQAPKAFENLFDKVSKSGKPLVVSYSPFNLEGGERPRVMTLDEIANLARATFGQVEVTSAGQFLHSKLRGTDRDVSLNQESEWFLICYP